MVSQTPEELHLLLMRFHGKEFGQELLPVEATVSEPSQEKQWYVVCFVFMIISLLIRIFSQNRTKRDSRSCHLNAVLNASIFPLPIFSYVNMCMESQSKEVNSSCLLQIFHVMHNVHFSLVS
jgi:hypothetical protein